MVVSIRERFYSGGHWAGAYISKVQCSFIGDGALTARFMVCDKIWYSDLTYRW